jgi:hypothetical protein
MLQLPDFNDSQLTEIKQNQMKYGFLKMHSANIDAVLESLGAVAYDMVLPETHALPYIIQPSEEIVGIVFGKYKLESKNQVGRGALVATNKRILLVDKKPFFEKVDELPYHVVSGVAYVSVGRAGTVTLHTRMGDVTVRTFNHNLAKSFVGAVEATMFQHAV